MPVLTKQKSDLLESIVVEVDNINRAFSFNITKGSDKFSPFSNDIVIKEKYGDSLIWGNNIFKVGSGYVNQNYTAWFYSAMYYTNLKNGTELTELLARLKTAFAILGANSAIKLQFKKWERKTWNAIQVEIVYDLTLSPELILIKNNKNIINDP